MKQVLMVLLVVAVWCGLASAGQVEDQKAKAKISATVKATSKKQKMMPKPEVMLARLTKGLNLSEEQQKQIKPLLEDEYAKLQEIRRNEELSPKTIQKKVEELRAETRTKVSAQLTPEQQHNYEMVNAEIKAAKQQRVKQNRKDRIGTKAETAVK